MNQIKKIKIIHSTEYVFDSEVFLEPHLLRFRIRASPYLNVSHFSLEIQSEPQGWRAIQDEENNLVDFIWFEGMTSSLSIKAENTVESYPYNPFDFILQPQEFNQLPFQYDDIQRQLLLPSMVVQGDLSYKLIKYGNDLLIASRHNTIQYLKQLTYQLHRDFTIEYREEGSPLLPSETFELKRGSCRDISWMQINLLRHQGIASRFVSGYFYMDLEKPAYELHAWLEVFLPGTGWLGLDPSHGIFAGNAHLPAASSAYFENTMPISGNIRGSAQSKLITQLSMEVI